jgi:hypothetical protein
MLVRAVGAAVESAAQTDGLVDPTLGHALVAVGYDRDISLVLAESSDPAGIPVPARAGGWPVAITETIDDPAGAEVVHLPYGGLAERDIPTRLVNTSGRIVRTEGWPVRKATSWTAS